MAADSDPPRDGGCSLLTETSSGRWCVVGALVTVVSGGLFLLLPVYTSVETSDGAASADVIRGRAMDVPRIRPLLVDLVPIAISITPVPATQRHLRTVLAVSATLLSLYAVLGGASLGLFVAPAAILQWMGLGLKPTFVSGPRGSAGIRTVQPLKRCAQRMVFGGTTANENVAGLRSDDPLGEFLVIVKRSSSFSSRESRRRLSRIEHCGDGRLDGEFHLFDRPSEA